MSIFGGLKDGVVVSILKLDEVVPDPNQPRKHFDEESIKDLAASIEAEGLIQPIIVRTNPDADGYLIVAGERRYRAMQRLKRPTIEAILRDNLRSPKTAALIENIQRVNLSGVEEADAIYQLMEDEGIKQGKVGELIGRSRTAVNKILKIRDLPDEIKAESIALGTNRTLLVELAQLKDGGEVQRLWRKVKAGGITSDEVRNAGKRKTSQHAQQSEGSHKTPFERALERAFSAIPTFKAVELTAENRERLIELREALEAVLTPEDGQDR